MSLGLAVLPAISTTGHSLPAQPIHLQWWCTFRWFWTAMWM